MSKWGFEPKGKIYLDSLIMQIRGRGMKSVLFVFGSESYKTTNTFFKKKYNLIIITLQKKEENKINFKAKCPQCFCPFSFSLSL
jgi:hypothetical protein